MFPVAALDIHLLRKLASLYGIDYEYWGYAGNHCEVSSDTLQAVLKAMGVEVYSNEDIAKAIHEAELNQWRKPVPDCVISREDDNYWVRIHLPHGRGVLVELYLEDGSYCPVEQVDHWVEPRQVDGVLTGEATFNIPAGLPLGWHRLVVHIEGNETHYETPVAITPARLPEVPLRQGRAWGVMSQFYAGLTSRSWGIGDSSDLKAYAQWLSEKGADFLLVNPVHASQLSYPLENSPYLPCSRRFWNANYIAPEAIVESQNLSADLQEELENWHQAAKEGRKTAKITTQMLKRNPRPDCLSADYPYGLDSEAKALTPEADNPFYNENLIDRDWSWYCKLGALKLIHAQGLSPHRKKQYQEFCEQQGEALKRFALWNVLVEKYGFPLPENYSSFNSEAVQSFMQTPESQKDSDFYQWLQWIIFEQLQTVQETCKAQGMSLGIMHDLAVGIHSSGADVWANPELFAKGISVGAPADMYNQLGQNWSQPPWLPQALEKTAYQPIREVVKAAAQMGGALRIDHVMGFLRLWWIPQGALPKDGTYVRYNHQAMIGVLLLEAYRQGILVVGEDLGTVEPWVREYLDSRGILGTGVFWFEREGTALRAPNRYRTGQLAAVNTHDMPPAFGYLQGEDLLIRKTLNLLEQPLAQAQAEANELMREVIQALQWYGSLSPDFSSQLQTDTGYTHKDLEEIVIALHRYVGRSPSKLVVASLSDLSGQVRSQNQPGTNQEYPNWRMPLQDSKHLPVELEQLKQNEFALKLLQVLETEVHSR